MWLLLLLLLVLVFFLGVFVVLVVVGGFGFCGCGGCGVCGGSLVSLGERLGRLGVECVGVELFGCVGKVWELSGDLGVVLWELGDWLGSGGLWVVDWGRLWGWGEECGVVEFGCLWGGDELVCDLWWV